MSSAIRIEVPGQRERMEPPSPDRIRAFKRHLIEAMRDLAAARRPERLVQKRAPDPAPGIARLLGEACGHCGGSCCMAGGTHAFLDERTLARVRAERPELTGSAALRVYVRSVAPRSYRGSCLFHGATGCTLARGLRAELCNAYYCNGLRELLAAPPPTGATVIVDTHAGEAREIRA